jgi:tetratricopeptide (TPR) repeat protein
MLPMRKLVALTAVAIFAFTITPVRRVSAECPGANVVAVNLSNEGDQLRATDLEGAIAKYQQALEADPSNHRIVWKLVLAHRKREAWSDVANASERAMKLAPKHAGYAFMRGYALAKLAPKGEAKWEDVRAALEKAVALDGTYADAHYELAEVLLRLRDERGALKHYTKAAELAPDQGVFYASLADLYIRLGYREHAEKTLEAGLQVVRAEKDRFPLFMLLADVLEDKGDIPRAVSRYEDARRACGDCSERGQQIVFFSLGAAYARLSPPRKSEAMHNLQTFQKMICKGAAAQRYADQCMMAQQLASKLGGSLQ